MRIDGHHHFWNYSPQEYGWIDEHKAVLQRDFGPNELKPIIAASNIDSVVSVQARQTLAETDWLLQIAQEQTIVAGVVGWVPLAAANVRGEIERLTHSPWFKAVRHVVQDEEDDAFILGRDFNRGISLLKDYGVVYDILIFAKHLPNTIEFVDRHPEQPFVVDHIAKPTIVADRYDRDWEVNMRELARRPNVFCKFSGVATEVRDQQWSIETIRPYWDVALESFGPERLMFGSDWPVCLLKSSYARWVKTVEQLSSQLSPTESERFWHETARQAYRLTRSQ